MADADTPALAPIEPITAVSDGRALSTAGVSHQGSEPAPATDPHRETRLGGNSAYHLSVATSPAADDATAKTTSVAATLAASSSPDGTVDTADGATAATAFARGSISISGLSNDEADPLGGARKRRRAQPHKTRVARRLGMHAPDGNAPPNPGMGTSHGADGS